MMQKNHLHDPIIIPLPRERILSRLGYNRHRTTFHQHHETVIENAIQLGFSYCAPRGIWQRFPITKRGDDFVTLATGDTITSRSLIRDLLANSDEVLLMATTVGKGLSDAITGKLDDEDAVRASIFDAVGSETADECLGWLQKYVAQVVPREGKRVTKLRYSPGYGDLGLETQKTVFNLLELDKLNLTLTERMMLVPEKSVIGIAGIESS